IRGCCLSLSLIVGSCFCAAACEQPRTSSFAGRAPICAHRQAGYHQSARMHGFSSDLHSEFEQYFLPMKNHIRKRKCHSFHKLTPDDKENAQRLAREELTEAQHQDQEFNHYSSNKSLEMMERVAEKVRGRHCVCVCVLTPWTTSTSSTASDSNKVQSYLRILKYTILPEQGC
uniref:Unique cartilage matrix-associated protein C-terminal fragment n=1 Tax=Salmo trutta TaxID=8032 RepID=A0A673ZY80_SALTR